MMIHEIGKLLLLRIHEIHQKIELNPLPTELEGNWNRIVNYVQDEETRPKVQLDPGSNMLNCNIEGGVKLGQGSVLRNCYVAPNVDLIVDSFCRVEDTVFLSRTDDGEARFCEEKRDLRLVRTIHISNHSLIRASFIAGNIDLGPFTCLFDTTVCTGYDPRLHLKIGESFVAERGFLGFTNETELKSASDDGICMGTVGSHLIILNSTVAFDTVEFELGDYALFARWKDVLKLYEDEVEIPNKEMTVFAFQQARNSLTPRYAPGLSVFRNGYHLDTSGAFEFLRDYGCARKQYKFKIGNNFRGIGIWRLIGPRNVTIGDDVTFFHMHREAMKLGNGSAEHDIYIGRGATIFEDVGFADNTGRSILVNGMRICPGAKVDTTGRHYRIAGGGRIEINSTVVTEI